MWESIAPEGPHETLLKLVAPVAAAAIAIASVQGQGRAAQRNKERVESGDGGKGG